MTTPRASLKEQRLETALRDLLAVISADDLIPESVSYMRQARAALLDAEPEQGWQEMADAAEMLWVVLANVSGGDWTKQSPDWQEYAARWRDNYFEALKRVAPPRPSSPAAEEK